MYQATAHAKDLSDSECGGAKHAVEKAQMKASEGETSKVKTPYEAFETIRDDYGQLSHERLIKKRGVGIYRRFIYGRARAKVRIAFPRCMRLQTANAKSYEGHQRR